MELGRLGKPPAEEEKRWVAASFIFAAVSELRRKDQPVNCASIQALVQNAWNRGGASRLVLQIEASKIRSCIIEETARSLLSKTRSSKRARARAQLLIFDRHTREKFQTDPLDLIGDIIFTERSNK